MIVQEQPSSDNSASVHPLRRAIPADAAAIREVTRAAYAKWVPVVGREPRPMNADYDAAVRGYLIDLLHQDDELAGLIEMHPEKDHLYIQNIAVSPAFQGRGYGRTLLAHAEEIARSLGLKEVRLSTNQRFTDSVRLYRRFGYRVDREEVEQLRGVVLYMSKSLCTVEAVHNSYVDDPRVQGFLKLFFRYGQVQSYVRPTDAVHMTAGPDGVR
jgi:ribosomal protein S18 acetylase RimI-like enzyme